jgi:putative endonuclease
MKTYYVYILTNRSGTLYTGVTSNLERRVWEHMNKVAEGFTKKYNLSMPVHYEETNDIRAAIEREKQIKSWRRSKKIDPIESTNPDWRDLADGWFSPTPPDSSLRSE